MRVGVIGLGKMGLLHAGIVNSVQDANVTAVCEKEPFFVTAAKALLPKRVGIYRESGSHQIS